MSWQEINPSGFKSWFYIIDRYGKTRSAYVTTGSLLMNPLFTFFPKNLSFIKNTPSYLKDRLNEGLSQNPATNHNAGMYFAYYNPMDIGDDIDISNKTRLEYFVGDSAYLSSIITRKYTARMSLCTSELARYFNSGAKNRSYGKMAGEEYYHPLNAFWENGDKKGIYRSFEFERERFYQRQAGESKYSPFNSYEISNGLK